MILVVNTPSAQTCAASRGDVLRSALAAVLLLALCAWLASTYIGHSPGPYGVCYAANGRDIPCELANRKR